jgi:hypothetical protein
MPDQNAEFGGYEREQKIDPAETKPQHLDQSGNEACLLLTRSIFCIISRRSPAAPGS